MAERIPAASATFRAAPPPHPAARGQRHQRAAGHRGQHQTDAYASMKAARSTGAGIGRTNKRLARAAAA